MTAEEHAAALARIDELTALLEDGSREPLPGEAAELDRLVRSVEEYEREVGR